MKKPKILIVDDDHALRSMYATFLLGQGYGTRTASNLAETRKKLQDDRFDALILDMMLPDGNSLDSVADFRADYPDMAIVVITAVGGAPDAVEAMRRGADNFLTKPVSLPDLDMFLRKALEVGILRRQQAAHQHQMSRREEPFFGQSPVWRKVVDLATIACENDSVVLLTGETGTGKGVLARWIHEHSSRRGEPFVEINCSSLRGEMLASELFGHVKGAFTTAVADKQGLVEVASSGTLFLDEIGDMDVGLQGQFLNVIEEKRYRRVGDVKDRRTDFRLICATNHDLEQLRSEGKFREDLLFRINVFPIRVPPLRDMREDLPDLIRYVLRSLRAEDVQAPPDVLEALNRYSWLGNIRELRNVLERALLLARENPLTMAHFPGIHPAAPAQFIDPGLNLEQIEQQKIRDALERFDGNTSKAARALGISRATLYRKLARAKEQAGAQTPGPAKRKGARS